MVDCIACKQVIHAVGGLGYLPRVVDLIGASGGLRDNWLVAIDIDVSVIGHLNAGGVGVNEAVLSLLPSCSSQVNVSLYVQVVESPTSAQDSPLVSDTSIVASISVGVTAENRTSALPEYSFVSSLTNVDIGCRHVGPVHGTCHVDVVRALKRVASSQ